jgi:diacylglycerol O-acyltransferase / wax synthase
MTVLYTEGGMCYLGINYDTASITEPELFVRCLREGFDEVLALEKEPPRRRTRASTAKETAT